MKYKCIMVRSVTYAQKAKKLLEERGITALISKQNLGEEYSCAWCVKVPEKSVADTLEIMEKNGVKRKGDEIFDLP